MQDSPRPNPPINTLSIVSAVLAILTFPGVICCAGYITGIGSVTVGMIALRQIRSGEYHMASKPVAVASVWFSLLVLLVGAGFNVLSMVVAESGSFWSAFQSGI